MKIDECTLIVGESGSGKSTFFKQLASDIIYENSLRNDYELYPFIIKFSDFEECNFEVADVLKMHLNSPEIKAVQLDLKELILKGNYVLFIDGLDELGTQELKEKSLEAIHSFRASYPEVKIYCSSRPGDSLLGSCQKLKFRYLEITNVSAQQVEQYINRYFNNEEIKCKRLLKSLKDSNVLNKLPKTPLTLALIAAIFDENEFEIPATISDLYKYFVELLLAKSLQNSTLDLLKIGIQRSVLSFIAEHLHVGKRKQIVKSELIDEVKRFASERGHNYEAEVLVKDLVENVGLLIENERGEIEFKHLSFQEYLTAYQFYNHNINGKSNFINNFNDIWWQNVAIFFAGMTKDSPELMHEILEKSMPSDFRGYINNLGGIGYLMQALYNTPISARVEGVKRNIDNTVKALDFLLTTEDPNFDLVRGLFHTQFGAHKLMSYWYEMHHTSITLKAPLELEFELQKSIIIDEKTNVKARLAAEYSAYLLASTLADVDDFNFSYLRELLSITDNTNYFVVGLIESNFNYHLKKLSKEEKRRKDIKKFQKRLNLLDSVKIFDSVNVRLLDGKRIQKKPLQIRRKNKRK